MGVGVCGSVLPKYKPNIHLMRASIELIVISCVIKCHMRTLLLVIGDVRI